MEIVKTIDVGHPPLKPDQVEHQLDDLLLQAYRFSSLRVIKIIHGRSGNTKITVRNWLYKKRNRLRGIIYGENYTIFDKQTQEMHKEVGQFPDSDLETSNSGITIVWIK